MPAKLNNHKSGALAKHKARLRAAAEDRQKLREAHPPAEQLTLLEARPGSSRRERERLSAAEGQQ